MRDPRPLTSEPLAFDLVNTEWIDEAGRHDLLVDAAGAATWLAGAGLDGAPTDAPARVALISARRALRAAIEAPGDPATHPALDAVLGHGLLRLRTGAEPLLEVDDERWRAPWLAVRDLLEPLAARPDRVRSCANHDCVLVFYDSSRNGTRQWCSMASCGNRAKARRHYARSRGAQ